MQFHLKLLDGQGYNRNEFVVGKVMNITYSAKLTNSMNQLRYRIITVLLRLNVKGVNAIAWLSILLRLL